MAYSDKLVELLQRLNEHQLRVAGLGSGMICVVGVPGCLTGDTLVRCDPEGMSYFRPIKLSTLHKEGLYSQLYSQGEGLPPRRLYSASTMGDHILPNQAMAVTYSGTKKCIQLKADDGSLIGCTKDHLFLTTWGVYLTAVNLRKEGVRVVRFDSENRRKECRIVDIKDIGWQRTYDVEMAEPFHNFEANGFIVHNSGKTGTIVARIARLVADGLDPKYILAMTFTKAAAAEMALRLKGLGVDMARVSTIHSVSRSVIAESSDLLDYARLDEKGALIFELRKILSSLRRTGKVPRKGTDFEAIQRYIGACKSGGICNVTGDPFGINSSTDEHLLRTAAEWTKRTGIYNPQALLQIYMEMEHRRASLGLMDFDDMLLWAWSILLTNEEERLRWRNKYSVVIVDECQDSSPVQWDVSRLLVGLGSCIYGKEDLPFVPEADDGLHNLMVAGDPSQSIYAWRNAKPNLFLDYWHTEGVTSVTLPLNYRSDPLICKVSTGLVLDKKWHLGGEIKAVKERVKGREEAVRVVHYETVEEEAATVVRKCREIALSAEGGLRSCAILARLKVSLDLAEIECIRSRIRYIKMASGSFFESTETADILAYLRVAAGFDPKGEWMRRIVNKPFRFISNAFIDKAKAIAGREGVPLMTAILGTASKDLTGRQRYAMNELHAILKAMHELAVKAETAFEEAKSAATDAAGGDGVSESSMTTYGPHEAIGLMLRRTGYIEALKRDSGYVRFDESKETAIAALQRIASQFLSYREFLGYVDQVVVAVKQAKKAGLRLTEGSTEDALVLSTCHRGKGLEWPHVFVIDVTEGTFPCSRAEIFDEELRLFFVAVSRAAESCEISYSGPKEHASVFVKKAEDLLFDSKFTKEQQGVINGALKEIKTKYGMTC